MGDVICLLPGTPTALYSRHNRLLSDTKVHSMIQEHLEEARLIQALNDSFRSTLVDGKVMLTSGVMIMGEGAVNDILALVRSYDDFTPDNDPYGEHDFGKVLYEGETLFWKIDYYDADLKYGSNNPADPSQTIRVLTMMLAEEY